MIKLKEPWLADCPAKFLFLHYPKIETSVSVFVEVAVNAFVLIAI